MNPEFPPNNSRAEFEARLTAFILGELPAHEAAALRQAMDEDAELAALYERLKTTSKLVREAAASPVEQAKEPPTPLRLSEERREMLLAQFKTVTPKEFVPASRPGISGRRLLEIAAVLAMMAILAGLLLPSLARSKSKSLSAVNRLRQMEWNKSYHEADSAPEPARRSPEKTATVSGAGGSVKQDLLKPVALPPPSSAANSTIVLPPAENLVVASTTTLSGYKDTSMEWNPGTGTHQPETRGIQSVHVYSLSNAEVTNTLPSLQNLFGNALQNSSPFGRSQTLSSAFNSNAAVSDFEVDGWTGNFANYATAIAGGNGGAKMAMRYANPSGISGALPPLATKSGQQSSSFTNSYAGDPEWIGFLEHPDQRHSASNFFVSRSSPIALPADELKDSAPVTGARFARLLQDGSFDTNFDPEPGAPVLPPPVAVNFFTRPADQPAGLTAPAPEVEIKAKFADITQETNRLAFDWKFNNSSSSGQNLLGAGGTQPGFDDSAISQEAGETKPDFDDLLHHARQAQDKKNYLEADETLQRILKIDPGNSTALAAKRENSKLLDLQSSTIPSQAKIERIPAWHTNEVRTAAMVQDGKLLFEAGKLDEAEAKLAGAYQLDPGSVAARQYLELIREKRMAGATRRSGLHSEDAILQVEKAWDVEQRQGKLEPHLAPDSGVDAGVWSLFSADNFDNSGKINGSITKQRNVNLALTTPPAQAAKSPEAIIRAGEVDFPEVPADQLLDAYGQLTGRTVLKPSNLPSTQILVESGTDRTKSEAIRDIEGALASNGIAVINVGEKFVKAVPVPTSGTLGSPFLSNGFVFDDQKTADMRLSEPSNVERLEAVGYVNVPMTASSSYAPTNGAINIATDEAVRRQANPTGFSGRFQGGGGNHVVTNGMYPATTEMGNVTVTVDPETKRSFFITDSDTAISVSNTIRQLDGNGGSNSPNVLHYNSIKIEAETEYAKQGKLLKELKKLPPEELEKTLSATVPDSVLTRLVQDKKAVETKLAKLRNDFGDQNPEVIRIRKLLDENKRDIDLRVKGIIQGIEIQAKSRSAQANISEAKLADAPLPKPAADAPIPQPEVMTGENAFSTFSLNVADVSFKLAAASLEKGQMPDPSTIRSEEFVNAFDYRDPEPGPGAPLGFAWERAQYPFAHNRDLLRFAVKTAAAGREAGRPMNIVLLLDKSGSMERADRVQIIHEALRVLATQLGPQDKLSVVTFARVARLWVDGLPGSQAGEVVDGLDKLTPEGGTNLEEAMRLAYETARRHYLAGGFNRVVLLTDGAANLGNVDPAALNQKVEQHRKEGIALDCFGVGWEGYNDDLLEVLSRHGDGRYGFINTPEEAANSFAKQLAGALRMAAADVKVQVEFNPKRVTAYRQIGYAKHQLTKEQFRDNTVDAAEIGAAESGNALYVVEVNPNGEGPLATVRVRYKVPGTEDYPEHEWSVPYAGNATLLEQASAAMRLAGVASAFSESLATSPFAGEVTSDQLLGLMRGVPETYGADERPKKLEWMIRQAKSSTGK